MRQRRARDGEGAQKLVEVTVKGSTIKVELNGTVILEWLNVSGGVDANPDYASVEEELLRGGYAWVGVSAQVAGVNGGMSPGFGLKTWDPDRYGTLVHPGDSYAYDIFTPNSEPSPK